jgi:hypothetical protein
MEITNFVATPCTILSKILVLMTHLRYLATSLLCFGLSAPSVAGRADLSSGLITTA